MILLVLITSCTPTLRELIAATRYRCPLDRLSASRLLPPRSRLEQRLWALANRGPDLRV